MKEYEITTRTKYSKATFLTEGKNVKSALKNLINRSADFQYSCEHCDDKLRITIKLLK